MQDDALLNSLWRSRVRVLLDRAVDLTGTHNRDYLLQLIVESAAAISKAQYSALGVYDDAGAITSFVHYGMDAATVKRIGELPHGLGLLGRTIVTDTPIRLHDLCADDRSVGFPAHHPPMHTFIGVPIVRRDRRYGNLYVTDKLGGEAFSAEDEELVVALAAFAACAIEGVMLVESERARTDAVVQQMVTEERENARRELLGAVIAAQEAERTRVSRDLHDDIGQALTSVLLGLQLIDNTVRGEAGEVSQRVAELREIVADALRRTRKMAFDLRPAVLDDIGLDPALQRLVADVAARSGLTVDATVDGVSDHEGVAREVATVVYRVVQEALTNIVRHAGASRASVAVTVSSGRLRAIVEDNGVGFDSARLIDGHLGLAGMRERAELVGGTIHVISQPGSGTTVVLEVPVG